MPFEIIPPGTRFDFVGRFRLCAASSLLLMLFSAAAIPVRGIRLGVDFAGGYQVVVRVANASRADEGGVRAALVQIGVPSGNVTRLGPASDGLFRVQFATADEASPDQLVPLLEAELARTLGETRTESVDFVGPRMGADLRRAALLSLGISFLLILAYVAFRFSPTYAPGAVLALIHDVLITAGVFVLCGWEFDLNVIAALLTIVGYSINDTIVIYDRIRERRERRTSTDLADVINQSLNETLSRTILTAGTTLLAVLALLVLGGPELRGFSAAMTIGIVVGTYSSIYVASPIMMILERRLARPAAAPRAATPGKRPARRRGAADA